MMRRPRRQWALAAVVHLAVGLPLLLAGFLLPQARIARAEDAGYALAFDGVDDFVQLAATTHMLGEGWQTSKTISLWVRPAGPGIVCANATPAWCPAIAGDRPRWWGLSQGTINGLDRLWVWNFDNSPGSAYDLIGLPYTPGEWVHVAFVHGGGTLQAYLNGELAGAVISGATVQPNTGALPVVHLGGIINSSSRIWTFAGQLDEVSLWNVARGQGDLQQDMFRALAGTEPGLRAYYRMSNGAGLSLTDDSGNGWTGLLSDGAPSRGVPGNGNPPAWVISGAFDGAPVTATPTVPGATPTATLPPATLTPISEPSATVAATVTTEPPSPTPETPTATAPPPSNTAAGPTATATPSPLPPTATDTPLPPTATDTPLPPTHTPTSVPASPTPPITGGFALQFDGVNDFVELPSAAAILGAGWPTTKTASLWVQPLGADTCLSAEPTSCDAIFGDRPRTWGIVRGTRGGLDRIWVWNYDGTFDVIGLEYTPGEWIHVTLVHGGGLLRAYRNGVEVGSLASGPTQSGGPQSWLNLGGVVTTASRHWLSSGQFDEVQLWNVARTPAEVEQDLYRILSGAESGLRAYYRMSTGAGLSLIDDSGHGFSGTLFDGARGLAGNGAPPLWVSPGAIGDVPPSPTPTPLPATATSEPATPTPTVPTATNTPETPATATPTPEAATPTVPPATPTSAEPTSTAVPPTATPTDTPLPAPSATPAPPTPTSPPGTLVEVAAFPLPDDVWDAVLHGDHLFVAAIQAGLRILNVSDPYQPYEVGYYDAVGPVYAVAVVGDYAYLAEGREGLRILDISNLAQPIAVGRADTPEFAWGVAVDAGIAYVADRWGGLRIIDVTDPGAPLEIASLAMPDQVTGVAVAGSYVYVAAYSLGGLRIVDVANPASPVEVGAYPALSSAYNVAIVGQHAFVADGGGGLRIIDVGNPTQPAEVGAYDTLGWARDVVVIGDLVYLADDGMGGLRLIDAANRAAPVEIGAYDTPGRSRGVATDGVFIYVADYEGGIRVLILA